MATTSGPFNMTAGQVFTVNDPAGNSNNVVAQFQNLSGFQLNISTPIGLFSLPPNTAATWPTEGGAPFTVTVGPLGLAGAGLIVQWLLSTDTPRVPDGPIPVQYIPPSYLTSSAASHVSIGCGVGPVSVIAAPAAGTINVLGLCSIRTGTTNVEFLVIQTLTSATTYYDDWVSIGPPASGTAAHYPDPFIIDASTSEAVVASLSANGTGSALLTIAYRNVMVGP